MAFTYQWRLGPPDGPLAEWGELLFQSVNRYEVDRWGLIANWSIHSSGLVVVHVTVNEYWQHYTSVVLQWRPPPPAPGRKRRAYVQGSLLQEEGPDRRG